MQAPSDLVVKHMRSVLNPIKSQDVVKGKKAAMRFEQVQRFILANKIFGVKSANFFPW